MMISVRQMELDALGLDSWFKQHVHNCCDDNQSIARVIAIDRGRILLRNGTGEFSAELLGSFFYAAESAAKFPCVGDWVCVEHHESDDFASIHHILPRKTLLKRKTVGYNEEFQILASNIDIAFIVMACHYDFNIAKLERFLVMIHEAKIKPILLFTKIDLMPAEELQALIDNIRASSIDIEIMAISNVTGSGIDTLRQFLQAKQTYCLFGSSGVGKSTLMNQLIGEEKFKTQAVSDSGQGKHTTVRRHLFVLEQGAMIIDMPGMRDLATSEVKEGIESSFADVVALADMCRFSNCTHNNEPDCAIQVALASNELNHEHYKNYLKIKRESQHHKKQTSFVEKRRKGKNASRVAPSKTKQRKMRFAEGSEEE